MKDPFLQPFTYANQEGAFALVEEYWSHHPSVFANAYHRIDQFGGEPGFQDIWTDPAKDRSQNKDSLLWWLTKMAVQTEIDLAMNGFSGELPSSTPQDIGFNVWRFNEEIAEYIAFQSPLPTEMLDDDHQIVCYRVAHASAQRVATALKAIF